MLFTCRAVLFDLDGVLVDSSAVVDRCWSAWADHHSLSVARVLRTARGRRTVETVQALAPHLDAKAEAARLAAQEAADTDGLRVVPGAAALLQTLPAHRWAVVTSGRRAVATARLRHARLPQPDVFITAEDVTNGKPDPEPYLKAARALGYAPSACLVLEDAPAGLQAARSAGMAALGVTTSHSPAELEQAAAHMPNLCAVHLVKLSGRELCLRCP